MSRAVLITELVLLALLLISLYLEFKYPCDKRVRILISIVVLVKVILIAHLMRQRGEKQGEEIAKNQMKCPQP
jgi:hypothetical protein